MTGTAYGDGMPSKAPAAAFVDKRSWVLFSEIPFAGRKRPAEEGSPREIGVPASTLTLDVKNNSWAQASQ